MKIDRLIGILSILLQKEMTTAPELADHFEVSRRTINRDIEALCKAGIPIQTSQGAGGGISIMNGYRMDRTILTSRDMQMILAGLRSLDSVSGSRYYGQLMEKIQAGSSEFVNGRDSILIDLSSWYRDTLPPKIGLIQDAIELRRRIRFDYYSPGGDTKREIEPYYLIFKWSSWYAYGFCLLREDFRLFKLNRMDSIVHGEVFDRRSEIPLPELSNEKVFPAKGRVKAVFDPSMKWQLVEEYGVGSFEEQPDGSLLFEHEYSDDEGLISWMLSCRDKVTVIEPESVRDKLYEIACDMAEKYERKGANRPVDDCSARTETKWRQSMRLDGFGILVEDMGKMIRFYRDVLGFEIKEEENTSNVYLVKDGTLFLLYGRKDFEKMTSRRYEYIKGLNGHFEIALYVDTFEEVDEAYKKAVENGETSVLEPELEPWGQRTCYIADPEGNLIEIGSWNKPYEEKDLTEGC